MHPASQQPSNNLLATPLRRMQWPYPPPFIPGEVGCASATIGPMARGPDVVTGELSLLLVPYHANPHSKWEQSTSVPP